MQNVFSLNEKLAIYRRCLSDVVEFANSPQLRELLSEMWQLPPFLRHEFVDLVVLNDEELSRRGVQVPPDMNLQRSWFEDERPTLFCITKSLPPGIGWKVVTVTVDNPAGSDTAAIWKPESERIS